MHYEENHFLHLRQKVRFIFVNPSPRPGRAVDTLDPPGKASVFFGLVWGGAGVVWMFKRFLNVHILALKAI